jgi:hypothetical protein
MDRTKHQISDLARIMAGFPATRQLDAALRAGNLPVDTKTREIIDGGLAVIKQRYLTARVHGEPRVDGRAFARIAEAVDDLIAAAFEDSAGRRAVSIMEEEAVWHPSVKMTEYIQVIESWSKTMHFYHRLYSYHKPKKNSEYRAARNQQDSVYYDIYSIYSEIKKSAGGAPPGNARPLYRFVIECAKLLGLEVRLSPDAFRMRMQRILHQRHAAIGSLGLALGIHISEGKGASLGQTQPESYGQLPLLGSMSAVLNQGPVVRGMNNPDPR